LARGFQVFIDDDGTCVELRQGGSQAQLSPDGGRIHVRLAGGVSAGSGPGGGEPSDGAEWTFSAEMGQVVVIRRGRKSGSGESVALTPRKAIAEALARDAAINGEA